MSREEFKRLWGLHRIQRDQGHLRMFRPGPSFGWGPQFGIVVGILELWITLILGEGQSGKK